MCKTLVSAETQAVSSVAVAKSTSFPHSLRRTTAFTGRVMRGAMGGFVAFLEEVPSVMAHGTTPDEAEWNLRLPFAKYVAKERSRQIMRRDTGALVGVRRTEKGGRIWHGYLEDLSGDRRRGLTKEIARRRHDALRECCHRRRRASLRSIRSTNAFASALSVLQS